MNRSNAHLLIYKAASKTTYTPIYIMAHARVSEKVDFDAFYYIHVMFNRDVRDNIHNPIKAWVKQKMAPL